MDELSRMVPIVAPYFYKDYLYFVEQGKVKLGKSIIPTLTAQNNQVSFSFKIRNTLYSDVSKQSVPATISYPFKKDDLTPLANVDQLVSKSGNCNNHVTNRGTAASSNVCETEKRLYQCKPVKAVCSSNVSKQNVCNVRSVSKFVKPLTSKNLFVRLL